MIDNGVTGAFQAKLEKLAESRLKDRAAQGLCTRDDVEQALRKTEERVTSTTVCTEDLQRYASLLERCSRQGVSLSGADILFLISKLNQLINENLDLKAACRETAGAFFKHYLEQSKNNSAQDANLRH